MELTTQQRVKGTSAPKMGGKAVRVTEVRILDGSDLVERLTDMRVWLDERGFEPSTFTYFFVPTGMKIQVSFRV